MLIVGATTIFAITIGAISSHYMVTSSTSKKTKTNQGKKESPKRKEITKIRFTEDDMKQKRKPAYYMKIVKVSADFELIWIDATPGTDGYGQELFNHIKHDDGFRDEGVLMVVRRRISKFNNSILTNTRDTYPRRAIVRLVDISTPESRIAILHAFKTYLMLPGNNKYGYDYVVNEGSDLTPPNAGDLESLDNYVQDDMIVTLIMNVYENTDQTWYNNNRESASDFFSGPTFPQYAIDQLGFPPTAVNENGIAVGFNMAPNNQA